MVGGHGNGIITNNWCTTTTQYSFRSYITSSDSYTNSTIGRVSEDELKNQILKLNESFTADIQNEDGTWKYNDGYPILKWQTELK